MEKKSVVIIGAGLAGLSCARELSLRGVDCTIIEKSDAVGGRIRTDKKEGFLLDRGFQVILDAYPEIQNRGLAQSLELAPFEPGAFIRRGGRWHLVSDPIRRPLSLLKTLLAPIGSLGDKLLVRKLRSDVLATSLEDLSSRPHMTTRQHLRSFGFSNEMLDNFFSPFFGGVFLEKELSTSAHKFDFLFKMFSQGNATLPREGMQSLPEMLARELPNECIVFKTEATQLQETTVTTNTGKVFEGECVVFAGYEAERMLVESTPSVGFHGTTCLYFAANYIPPILKRPYLLLNAEGKGLINNLCCLSSVTKSYAPENRHLVSVSVLGIPQEDDEKLSTMILHELISWFGTIAQTWKPLAVYRIPQALPIHPPGVGQYAYRLGSRLLRCGDHVNGASINGALESGKKVARIILEDK
jgi:protoporphyrinogen oxidase